MRIDGKAIAENILQDLQKRVEILKEKGIMPHLLIITLSNNPSSSSYVRQKILRGKQIGAKVTVERLNEDTSNEKLVDIIKKLNNDSSIQGIIIQRPLPKHINNEIINKAVIPTKDVDGFNPDSNFETPVAAAVLKILEKTQVDLTNKKIACLGKGLTAGGPIIKLLEKKGITPDVLTSKTENKQAVLKQADIIISAVGKAGIVNKTMIKEGVVLIGVGLHPEDENKLHGDYLEEDIKNIASFYTPTPGGVGPVNVSFLFKNLIEACEKSLNLL